MMELVVNNKKNKVKRPQPWELEKINVLMTKILSEQLSDEETRAVFIESIAIMKRLVEENDRQITAMENVNREKEDVINQIIEINLFAEDFLKGRGLWEEFRDYYVKRKLEEI